MVAHGSLAGFLAASAARQGLGPGDVVASMASYAFDVWVLEVLQPLAAGAATRIVPRADVPDPERLLAALADAGAAYTVPAVARALASHVRARQGAVPPLRTVFIGGDAVPPELLREVREAFPGAVQRIAYGPTEATVAASEHLVDGALPERVVIGREIEGVRGYVLDAAGEPVPAGVAGELVVGGAGVGRGYLDRPGLTAERFVPDPFSELPGARAYRTGDRVRRLPDGTLEFLGRIDHQVKIRGFRIETGEIEAVLERHPAVAAAVVVAREDSPGERRLVAYVEAAPDGVDDAALRALAREHLPEYMVPAAFVALERLPLSPNGKVDRRALPAPEPARRERDGADAPRTAAERAIAAVWEEVLGVRGIALDESFFDLGGNSLLLVRLSTALEAALGVPVPVLDLFQHATVRALARRLAGAEEEPAAPAAAPRGERLARGRDRLGSLRRRG